MKYPEEKLEAKLSGGAVSSSYYTSMVQTQVQTQEVTVPGQEIFQHITLCSRVNPFTLCGLNEI